MVLPNPPVIATWNPDGTVAHIAYQNQPLPVIRDSVFSKIAFGPPVKLSSLQGQMITDLLDAIFVQPASEKAKKIHLATRIFENLNFRTSVPNPWLTNWVWRAILDIVWQWEQVKETVHKGTPYYFMGENYLQMGDVASAYICFYNAVEEDKTNYPTLGMDFKQAPAYLTVSLVDDARNRLHQDVVIALRSYLDSLIQQYNTSFKRKLDLTTLDRVFLQEDDLEAVKRFFVANLHEIYHLAPLNSPILISNDYSELKVIDSLFDLALVVDQILAYRFLRGITGAKRNMANSVYQLALHLKLVTKTSVPDASVFLGKVNPKLNDPNSSPDTILPDFLNHGATYDGNAIDDRLSAALTAYYLRNYRGHHLEGSKIVAKRYTNVLASVINAFFVAIETL